MKYLVLSDVHGNLPALEAVLAEALPSVGSVLCLGDTVGYGPEPSACVSRLRGLPERGWPFACVAGNHDAAATGLLPTDWFNSVARFAIGFTRKMLSSDEAAWLASLPLTLDLPGGAFATHGSPLEPLTGYLFGGFETLAALEDLERKGKRLCFVGHTHVPAHFTKESGQDGLRTPAGTRWRPGKGPGIVNPGGVGFPRSRLEREDPAYYPAEYAVWDDDSMEVEFRECRYDRRPLEERLRELYDSAE